MPPIHHLDDRDQRATNGAALDSRDGNAASESERPRAPADHARVADDPSPSPSPPSPSRKRGPGRPFQPGNKGGGRPRTPAALRQRIARIGPLAVRTLEETLKSPKAGTVTKLRAALEV